MIVILAVERLSGSLPFFFLETESFESISPCFIQHYEEEHNVTLHFYKCSEKEAENRGKQRTMCVTRSRSAGFGICKVADNEKD